VERRVLVVCGTRPDAIKLAPVIRRLLDEPTISLTICATGQHRQMLDAVFEVFGITPDVDLDIMRSNQDLFDITANCLVGLRDVITSSSPDLVLVHGDTSTAFAAALSAYYLNIPIAHVEAGLRSGKKREPFPEEMNRVLVDQLADILFAPTAKNHADLLKEGIPADRIIITGNTVIDALLMALERVKQEPVSLPLALSPERRLILITGHRRESFGVGLRSICHAVKRIALLHPDVDIVYPVHLNPRVREAVFEILSETANVYLIEPIDYLSFVALMDAAYLILTDSGGIQEEAPTLNTPLLVMRNTTERHEVLDCGAAKLVGTQTDAIVEETSALLQDTDAYQRMAEAANPYGDGRAAERIVDAILKWRPEDATAQRETTLGTSPGRQADERK
jgi:UDP-N-acetylglucosamine 2-epimerase (non-hydrolysing)